MESRNIIVDFPDLFKYAHLLRKFSAPDAFSGHSHNAYEFLYIIKGDATYVIEDKRYKLKSGDLIVTRPSKYHFIQIDSQSDYERLTILFDKNQLNIKTNMLPEDIDVVRIKDGSIISNIFSKMDYYAGAFNKEDFLAIVKLLLQEIIYNLSLVEKKEDSDFSVINPLLSKALAYIGDNLFTIKDIEEVAAAVFVTESYLFRLFKKELFKSPKKYINEKRLLYAQNQLKKGRSPTETAQLCGFEDYTTFYRNYISMFGKRPSDEE
jgi:AraC-like DNA-binding protein